MIPSPNIRHPISKLHTPFPPPTFQTLNIANNFIFRTVDDDLHRAKRPSVTINQTRCCENKKQMLLLKQSSAYDLISRHAVAVMYSGQ